VLGTQFTAPLPDPAKAALAATGFAIGLYLVAAIGFLVIGFLLHRYGTRAEA
jgi:hypothetical protein